MADDRKIGPLAQLAEQDTLNVKVEGSTPSWPILGHRYRSQVKNYELLEHTADISIRVKGADLRGLFINTALAMFEIIAEKKESKITAQKKIPIKQQADNLEELFINWLNELLSLSATKELIFTDFAIDELEEKILRLTAIGEDIKNYKVNTEIKAATYHQLKIEKVNSGWQAEVIFDV